MDSNEKSKTLNIENLYIGKTPKISENQPSHIIGIIDCSGSMSSHFSMLCEAWNELVKSVRPDDVTTVLFSCEARLKEGNLLEQKDCSGSTNILAGFELAFKEMENLKKSGKDDFIILFISDGEDNDSSSMSARIKEMKMLENVQIKLLCIGVGKNFPTFLSMELRLKYHNDSPSIPPVFLVFTDYDYNNIQNEFQKTFLEIKQNYLNRYELFEISPPVFRFPWLINEGSKLIKFEENNFYISETSENLYKNERNILNKRVSELNEDETLELFKIWLQNLFLESLRKVSRRKQRYSIIWLLKKWSNLKIQKNFR